MMPSTPSVLVLAPQGRDAQIAASILSAHQIDTRICATLDEAVPLLEASHCLVVAEEALISSDRAQFAAWFESQPPWSDFPIVLLTMRGTEFDKRLAFLDRYMIVLERPFMASSLANSVRSALRARARQLEVKSYIEDKEQVAARQKLLIRELHHRVKNTLANVRAMMGATARVERHYGGFRSRFLGQDCVASRYSFHADRRLLADGVASEALGGELRHYDLTDQPRISLEGPDVALIADVAIPVGMAFHELASNSSKFGALSMTAWSPRRSLVDHQVRR